MRHFLLALFVLISFPAVAGGLEEVDLAHGGRDRLFLIHVPDNLKGQKNLPVVMALHGGGGSARQFAEHIKMEKTADQNGFIVVYPQGTGGNDKMHTWNAGKCCSYAMEQNVDDVGYISDVIDILVSRYGADPKRIYATGHSNGGMMSYRLACELSDKIAAIAPNSGQDTKRESCPLKRAVPVLHLHGKKDHCANYYGGTECGGCFQDMMSAIGLPTKGQNNGLCYPVTDMVAQWAGFDGCSGKPVQTFQKGEVDCQTYQDCRDGAEVTLCTEANAGHTWAGAGDSAKSCQRRPNGKLCAAWKEQIGQTNMDINANDFIWQFFKKYQLN